MGSISRPDIDLAQQTLIFIVYLCKYVHTVHT